MTHKKKKNKKKRNDIFQRVYIFQYTYFFIIRNKIYLYTSSKKCLWF